VEDEFHIFWECEGEAELVTIREEWLEVLQAERPDLLPPLGERDHEERLRWFSGWVTSKTLVPRLVKTVYELCRVVDSYGSLFVLGDED
jgi:hypothetical protein